VPPARLRRSRSAPPPGPLCAGSVRLVRVSSSRLRGAESAAASRRRCACFCRSSRAARRLPAGAGTSSASTQCGATRAPRRRAQRRRLRAGRRRFVLQLGQEGARL